MKKLKNLFEFLIKWKKRFVMICTVKTLPGKSQLVYNMENECSDLFAEKCK